MFSPIARRSTAVLTLVAALWLTTPLAAEAANRRPAPRAHDTLGSLFLDQVASWLQTFFYTPLPENRSGQQKAGTVLMGGADAPDTSAARSESPTGGERGGMIDPNGGS